jgi:predicted nucleic-acid-binding protein
VDTNVLVRAVVGDDPAQAPIAAKALKDAALLTVALPCLCELVWVLRRVYGFAASDVAAAVRALLTVSTVEVNRAAVEAGLDMLEAGGDFAYEGQWLGGETFVSFDKKAVSVATHLNLRLARSHQIRVQGAGRRQSQSLLARTATPQSDLRASACRKFRCVAALAAQRT